MPSVAASGEARAMTVAHGEAPAGFSAAPRLIRVPALHFRFDQASLDRSALEELERASLPKLMQARYVVRVEPLASMSASKVIDLVAPTFQHYLVEPLTA